MIHPQNARAVLAAGCLLGGMDDLCAFAYDVCRRSLSVETIDQWLHFADTIPPSKDGSATPDLPQTSVFGLYAQRIRDDVFHFLVSLPDILESAPSQPDTSSGAAATTPRDVLLQVYSRVPFELFKSAVESPAFTKAFFDLYIGPDPVSKGGKASIARGIANTVSRAGS